MTEKTVLNALHPVIPVREMRTIHIYYRDKLGFKHLFDDRPSENAAITYAGMGRDGVELHFQQVNPDENPTMPQIRVRVQNVDALFEEYSSKGVLASTMKVEAKPWGCREFGLYDPNKTALVFYEDV